MRGYRVCLLDQSTLARALLRGEEEIEQKCHSFQFSNSKCCVVPASLSQQGLTFDREELLREAAIMAQFVHPNVIRLVGVVTVDESLMIVLEYAGACVSLVNR